MLNKIKKEVRTFAKTGMSRSERLSTLKNVRRLESKNRTVLSARKNMNVRANKVLMSNMVNKYNASKTVKPSILSKPAGKIGTAVHAFATKNKVGSALAKVGRSKAGIAVAGATLAGAGVLAARKLFKSKSGRTKVAGKR